MTRAFILVGILLSAVACHVGSDETVVTGPDVGQSAMDVHLEDMAAPVERTDAGDADIEVGDDTGPTPDDASVTSVCGNGVVEADEDCDDGNRQTERCPYDAGDCVVCGSECRALELPGRYCGDGIIDEIESCDDGHENGRTLCSSECTPVTCGDGLSYRIAQIEGWRVCISEDLEDQRPDLSQEVLQALSQDLARVAQTLPIHATDFLRAVFIWVELDIEAFPGGVYHPSASWLTNHGYPAAWAGGVQLGNATNYLSWTEQQPAMVLHELTHAWHHQRLGYEYEPILEAFESAMSEGLYDSVAYVGGGNRPAYATSNHIEYFAELTEAWFWRNDFYPFVRDELLSHDPVGAAMVEQAWLDRP